MSSAVYSGSRRRGLQGTTVLFYILMIAIIIIVGIPLFWMVAVALKDLKDIYNNPMNIIPTHPKWSNFPDAWRAAPFGRFYINTIVVTVFGAGLQLTCGTLAAYALAFFKFPGKTWVFILVLAALMIPPEVTILPNYLFLGKTIRELSGNTWIDTYQGLILPGAATAFGTFLIRQGFLGLPKEVLEAATLDGAGHLRKMFGVVIPMSTPIIVTFGIISVVNKWNDYLWPLIITNSQHMQVLTIGVSSLFQPDGSTPWGIVMAGACFVLVPLIVLFILAQRYIIEGLTAGATKG